MSQTIERVLITGGAGYIGSHIAKFLAPKTQVVILDNLCTGFSQAVPLEAKFILGDVSDYKLVVDILAKEKITAVMHLAASTSVPESLTHPLMYYENNTLATLTLLKACIKKKIKHFIFSSTAAVYGTESLHIQETSPLHPINPYGYSKLMAEQILKDVAQEGDLRFVTLRYFNVAGADPDGSLGQYTVDASHLIKVATQTACGIREAMPIYGTDYDTPDGTCVRDFIHVSDIVSAHVQALHYLQAGGESVTLNCGYGHGYSVKDIIKAVEKLTQQKLPVYPAPRRAGDIPFLVADSQAIRQVLNWQPKFNDLNFIIQTALAWEKALNCQTIQS